MAGKLGSGNINVVLGAVLAVVFGVVTLGATTGIFFDSLRGFLENVSNAETGIPALDGFLQALPTILGLLGIAAFIAIPVLIFTRSSRG